MAQLTPLWTMAPTREPEAIRSFLDDRGIAFATWPVDAEARAIAERPALDDGDKRALLDLVRPRLAELDAEGAAHAHADVVAIRPGLPGLDEALATFDRVHYHDDDEVRAIVGGRGVFGFVGDDGRQFLLTVESGELISVPAGMWHWFYVLEERDVTAVRLFGDAPSWTPHYRDTARGGADRGEAT